MSNTATWSTCRIICWAVAVVIGLLVMWAIAGGVGFIAALMAAAALAVFIGLVATRLFCTGDRSSVGETAAGVAEAASQAGSTVADKASDAASATAEAAKSAASSASDMARDAAETGKQAAGDVKEGAQSAAQAAQDKVASGTLLKGEEELANRKGEWSYNTSGEDAQAAAAATPDYDGDGVKEGTGEGTRPEALSAPKGGKADNLKEIKGVGPKLEALLNEMGFYHFDQIANWGADEVAWVDANLKGFKGRVSRDNWVDQAKILAGGGETEFSKRARDGGVY